MDDSIPEYYRHLADETGEENGPEQQADLEGGSGDEETDMQDDPAGPTLYRADAFRLLRPEGEWQDGSVYTLTGPTIDGVTHNITINIDDEVETDSVYDFAAQELALVEAQLEKCRMLVDDPIELDCGEPAYRAIFVWYPEDDLKLYQEQIYVLQNSRGYTLTASFTRETRKRLGTEVERMMLSFTPTTGNYSS
jgi:hypothetical protein